jgi:hypothetical protein
MDWDLKRPLVGMTVGLALALASTAVAAETPAPKSPPPAAVAGAKVLEPQGVDVSVSATGEVTAVSFAAATPAPLRAPLEKAVRGWKFSPKRIDGVARDWAAHLIVRLILVPTDGGGYALKVIDVGASKFIGTSIKPPDYPADLMRAGRSARVCVELVYTDDKPAVARTWMDGELKTDGRRGFVEATTDAVKRWRRQPVQVNGQDVYDEHVFTSLNFNADRPLPMDAPRPDTCPAKLSIEAGNLELLTPVAGTML